MRTLDSVGLESEGFVSGIEEPEADFARAGASIARQGGKSALMVCTVHQSASCTHSLKKKGNPSGSLALMSTRSSSSPSTKGRQQDKTFISTRERIFWRSDQLALASIDS